MTVIFKLDREAPVGVCGFVVRCYQNTDKFCRISALREKMVLKVEVEAKSSVEAITHIVMYTKTVWQTPRSWRLCVHVAHPY